MPTYVEVCVNVPQVTGVFHYHLPPHLEGQVRAGHLVEAPFGKLLVQGIVLREVDTPEVEETKAVEGLIDTEPVLTPAQLGLANELSEKNLAPLSACIALMLPPGLAQQTDTIYSLVSQPGDEKSPLGGRRFYELTETQNRLIDLLKKRGPTGSRQIDRLMGRIEWKVPAQALVKRGYIKTHTVLPPPRIHPKNVRTVSLRVSVAEAEAAMSTLGKKDSKSFPRRQAVLKFLIDEPGPIDAAWVYAGSGGNASDLKYLAEKGLVSLGEVETWRDPLSGIEIAQVEPPHLTQDQEGVLLKICEGIQASVCGEQVLPFLLQGVTGSGKTEIYLRAVDETIKAGRQAVVLVPEIALTPQTTNRFLSRFPGQVGLIHSRLSDGERYDTWRRARLGQLNVIVGPRSALFAPCPRLGLIILDEAHDDSYYQFESSPAYNAREAALIYGRHAKAVVLFGTATPDIVTYYRAKREGWTFLSLPNRILAHKQTIETQAKRLGLPSQYRLYEAQAETIDLPPVQVVDMREELKEGNRSIFSRSLQAAIEAVLNQRQQAILFLNRRGAASYVFCRSCGYTVRCPRCDLPLTAHLSRPTGVLVQVEGVELRCHYCGYKRSMPRRCPSCTSDAIRQYGAGTETVETEVQALFPGIRTLRWDWETTRTKGAHEIILSHFSGGHADVLIGTQMIAKGLDLPLVTLVGMVLADVGLNLPDFRAPERTFQLLTQVAGRAGRSPLGGRVILQTFQPESYVIRAAARHDYKAFYAEELEYRRRLGYPPYSRLVRMETEHHRMEEAEKRARLMAAQIDGWIAAQGKRATEIIGPAPCFFSRIKGRYRWQIILRGPDPAGLLAGKPLANWRVEVDPVSLL